MKMGTFVGRAKKLSVLAGMAVGVMVGLIYQPPWWVISLASFFAWRVIEGVLKVLPWQPSEPSERSEGKDLRYIRH